MNQLLRSRRVKCKMDHTDCLSFILRSFWVCFGAKIEMSSNGKGKWSTVKTSVSVLIISL